MTEAITTTGSTVPRRQLGRYLRDLRNQSRLTVRAAAVQLEWSEAKIWRIETGQTALRSLDVEAMCKVYGAPPETTDGLMGLAKETKARGWWHSYADVISASFNMLIGLEETASHFSWYESELVPGLFQTECYAHTVIRAHNPDLSDAEIAQRVTVRMARQTLLTRVTQPPVFNVVLNEAILHRPVGGDEIMVPQLRRLRDISTLPTVSIRVIPFATGLHHGALSGPFTILRFPLNSNGQDTEPPTVYAESLTGSLFLDRAQEIDRYDNAFTNMWESSLDENASRTLITQVIGEREREHH